jgi:flagellin-like protein
MTQNNLKSCIRKLAPRRKRAVAEVISSLLLVAITVVGAVILTTFLDEAFISGGLAASGSDSTIKTIKLIKYDSRDGANLMGFNLNNTNSTFQQLCRISCASDFDESPITGGTEFIVIQVENQSVNPVYLHDVWLGNASHSWDSNTASVDLDITDNTSFNGKYPADGTFSILSTDTANPTQSLDNQLQSGQTVNLLIKLDTVNPDISLSKTIRAQFNIGDNQLSEFLIESGGAQ